MGWVDVGGRQTFLPPFVNERFDGPPYWACTFTAGLMGAYVARLNSAAPTQDEIRKLAAASGDPNVRDGSRTSHLATALLARYGLELDMGDVADAEVARRLGTGWVLIAGCTYGKLPAHYRRWSPGFTGGHRVILAGWSAGRTRLFDPMAVAPATYAGEWITWADFAPAFWADDQAWILEGELMQQVFTVVADLTATPRRFAIPAGATIQAYTALGPGKKGSFPAGSAASFDQVVDIAQLPDVMRVPHGRGFVRVHDGVFAGQYVASSALRDPDGSALDIAPPAATPVDTAAIELAARQAEYDRVTKQAVVTPPLVSVRPTVQFPARPA